MAKKKIRVALVFGGKSAEHEVSLRSARNVAAALDPAKYEVAYIGIEKSGRWLPATRSQRLLGAQTIGRQTPPKELIAIDARQPGNLAIDVVFPVLHGPFGEDGTLQGMLKLANVAYVGAGVLGSAVGMDKDVMKRLLRDAGIPVAKFLVFREGEAISFEKVKKQLGLPLFIKPANLGSSVGVSKATNRAQFKKAIDKAFSYDRKILIEEFIDGREIECSVLGNDHPIASILGEVIPRHEFYSYEAKYIDENGAALEIPAKLRDGITKKIQELAVRAFKALECEGMARVDFFLCKKDNAIFVNEINTIPGFTSISMYPKLWEASGLPYPKLIDRLIGLAIERFEKEQKLKTSP